MENYDSEKNKGLRVRHFGILMAIFLALSFWAGIHIGYSNSKEVAALAIFANSSTVPPENVDLSPLWKAWNVLENRFVPATTTAPLLSPEKKVWGAIKGLAGVYNDPYTVFFPPAESSTFEADINGSFGGVGIEIGIRNNVLTVIAPLKGTPGERAGIKSGDRIVEIDGKLTDRLSIDEAVTAIRGVIGTEVVFTMAREGESALKTIKVVRGNINIPTLDAELRSDGIFVISLYNFSAPSTSLFRAALREFINSPSDKLIIDLRNNPGGFLEASIDMASWFLPAGKVVVTEDFGEKEEPGVHRSKGYNVFTDKLKLVILVNGGSASASEILAGALQEHKVATLVGTKTFGKGSVQELVKITPETSLKVTIARWLTPNGTSISDGGLKPDIEVPVTEEDLLAERDPQLERAVKFLLEN